MYSSVTNSSSLDRPKRRPLRIYASDPLIGRNLGNTATVDVENESLLPGPAGERIKVVDFNASTGNYYPPIDLGDPDLLMQGGLRPTESDPRFHQQMVYAVAMRTLENFDRALGRRIYLNRRGQPLRLFPHAFYGANAYFDDRLNAVLFGYFRADDLNPGANLPGQTVFTCLSHDIIAHEVTHAIVNRLRRNFLKASNADVLAFHEGFSDLVALFQHFSFLEVVKYQLQKTGADLRQAHELLGLAVQFGHATSAGTALRSALLHPDDRLRDDIVEPHRRGSILVAAVFDAFISVYDARTSDILLLAKVERKSTKALHPLLAQRLAGEASRVAQSLLTMCIRAFDYMPPVDVTFGDFLRAVVTADFELSPGDDLGLRAALIEGFRLRGIFPQGVTSLAEESLLWSPAPIELPPIQWKPDAMLPIILDAATRLSVGTKRRKGSDPASAESPTDLPLTSQGHEEEPAPVPPATAAQPNIAPAGAGSMPDPYGEIIGQLKRYAKENAALLLLDPAMEIEALGVHPVFRTASNGRLVIELIAQVDQTMGKLAKVDPPETSPPPQGDAGIAIAASSEAQAPASAPASATAEPEDPQQQLRLTYGGTLPKGGTTLVVGFDGRIKYCVVKPLPGVHLPLAWQAGAQTRVDLQAEYVASMDARDPGTAYYDAAEFLRRSELRASMAALHFTR